MEHVLIANKERLMRKVLDTGAISTGGEEDQKKT